MSALSEANMLASGAGTGAAHHASSSLSSHSSASSETSDDNYATSIDSDEWDTDSDAASAPSASGEQRPPEDELRETPALRRALKRMPFDRMALHLNHLRLVQRLQADQSFTLLEALTGKTEPTRVPFVSAYSCADTNS